MVVGSKSKNTLAGLLGSYGLLGEHKAATTPAIIQALITRPLEDCKKPLAQINATPQTATANASSNTFAKEVIETLSREIQSIVDKSTAASLHL